jgi:hypothetical protein
MGITEDVDLQVAIGRHIETVRTLVNEKPEPGYGTVRRVHGIATPRCGSLQQLRSNGIGGVRRADAGQRVVAREDEGGQQRFEIRATRECISNDIVSTSLMDYVKVEVHDYAKVEVRKNSHFLGEAYSLFSRKRASTVLTW